VLSGRWFYSESDRGPFLHARLGTAQSNSGRLVTLLRERSREIAKTTGRGLILVDGPPGIGCPVIASLTGASYLLIVTEPSVSAIHDLERLADLAAHFDIRAGVCLNRWDISEEISRRIEQVAARRGLPLHGRIPYDPAFTEAQLRGQTYVQTAQPEGIKRIEEIWRSIQSQTACQDRPDSRRFAV
jgi:MinD superfamily P-loop ATPase